MKPVISVYNQAKTPLGLDLVALTAAMQAYVDGPLAAAWDVGCTLKVTDGPVPGTWGMVFLDTADVDGALAYHTDEGLPLSKVFVATTLNAHESLSVSASHELAEMLVDPGCNSWAMDASGKLYTFEVADAVEEVSFEVQGFAMSDFCYPVWFGQPGDVSKFSHMSAVSTPFELAKGGYCTTIEAGAMKQTFGSDGKKARFSAEDRRGRRGARRMAMSVSFSAGVVQPLIKGAPPQVEAGVSVTL